VRGYSVITAFNELKNKEVFLRVTGREVPGNEMQEIQKVIT
jgi:hypothetical protein